MAKFLDLTGLGTFKEKMQEWANGAFRKKTDKVVSTDVTYNGKSLDEAIKVENLREIKETEEKPAQLEHRDQQDQLVQ